jgi:carboxymethylenebutenolidase
MKIIRRISLACFACLVAVGLLWIRPATPSYGDRLYQSHAGDRPVPTLAVAQAPRQPVQSERVTYATSDGVPVDGYLSRPMDAAESLPGLIVIHEWWGLNDNIKMMSDRLAGEGYMALAVDLFNGSVADTREGALAQVQAAAEQTERLKDNLRQAYQYLVEQGATSVGSIGWCFGGSWSLQAALALPDQLDATVIYYGGQLVTDLAVLEPLEMPILGIFGSIDNNPSVETVRLFETALNALDKSVEIHIYEGADHAFANPSGTRYNEAAAEAAWQETLDFLSEYL